MSRGYCPYTTVAALKAADKMLGPNRAWRGNPTQDDWVKRFYEPIVPQLAGMPEIAANATAVPQEHVDFMARHGWEAQVKTCKPGEFLTGAVLDLLVRWKTEGTELELEAADGKTYPGAWLDDDVSFHEIAGCAAACIATKTADRVWLLLPRKFDAIAVAPDDPMALASFAQGFLSEKRSPARYKGLHFPMVDLSDKQVLAFMQGIGTTGQDGKRWEVLEALQQLTLKMNHKGARVRAADEMRLGVTSVMVPPPPLIIDRPFFTFFERPGTPMPIAAVYVTQESWKDPGAL